MTSVGIVMVIVIPLIVSLGIVMVWVMTAVGAIVVIQLVVLVVMVVLLVVVVGTRYGSGDVRGVVDVIGSVHDAGTSNCSIVVGELQYINVFFQHKPIYDFRCLLVITFLINPRISALNLIFFFFFIELIF